MIPVDQVQPTDLVDDLSNAKYGADDEKLYKLCEPHLSPFDAANPEP